MPRLKPCQKCGRDYHPLRRGYCNRCDMQRRARHGYRCSFVDAQPVREHVAVLTEAGIGLRRLAQISGVSRSTLTSLVAGRSERGTGPSKRLSEKTAAAILAVAVPAVPHDHSVAGHHLVDAIGTVRRAQAMVAFGYPRCVIARRIGVSPANATRLFDPATLRVTAETARKVAALFDELQATPGPSQRARNDGLRNGWEPPLAWDDDEIDHFAVRLDNSPAAPEEPLNFAELYEELRYLGYTDAEIAHREGIQLDSLYQRLRRSSAETAEATETIEAETVSSPAA